MGVLMILDAWPFDAKQNTKTIAQIARGEGITDVDAFIVWLDNNMRAQSLSLFKGQKQLDAIEEEYSGRKPDKKQDNQIRNGIKRAIAKSLEEKKALIAASTVCPSCKKGRMIREPGAAESICTYPKQFAKAIKLDAGCGWSEYVGE